MLQKGGGAIVKPRLDHGVLGGRPLPERLVPGDQGRGRQHDQSACPRMGILRDPGQRSGADLGAHQPDRPAARPAGIVERIAALTPLKRLATPDEIAWAILYLASPTAAMVTGHTLAVDGGFLAQ
jgi:hypothetical protein